MSELTRQDHWDCASQVRAGARIPMPMVRGRNISPECVQQISHERLGSCSAAESREGQGETSQGQLIVGLTQHSPQISTSLVLMTPLWLHRQWMAMKTAIIAGTQTETWLSV